MVSILTSNVVDRELEPRSGQTKDYKIVICCFFTKHAAVRRKNKTGWFRIRICNVSDWRQLSPLQTVVSVSWHYKNQHDYHLIECNMFLP